MNHKEMLNDWSININDITLTVFRVQAKETHLFLCECKTCYRTTLQLLLSFWILFWNMETCHPFR